MWDATPLLLPAQAFPCCAAAGAANPWYKIEFPTYFLYTGGPLIWEFVLGNRSGSEDWVLDMTPIGNTDVSGYLVLGTVPHQPGVSESPINRSASACLHAQLMCFWN